MGGGGNSTYFNTFLLSFQKQHNTLVGKGIKVQIIFQEDLLFLFIQNSFYPKGRPHMGCLGTSSWAWACPSRPLLTAVQRRWYFPLVWKPSFFFTQVTKALNFHLLSYYCKLWGACYKIKSPQRSVSIILQFIFLRTAPTRNLILKRSDPFVLTYSG